MSTIMGSAGNVSHPDVIAETNDKRKADGDDVHETAPVEKRSRFESGSVFEDGNDFTEEDMKELLHPKETPARDWLSSFRSGNEALLMHGRAELKKVRGFLSNTGYLIRCPKCDYAAPA